MTTAEIAIVISIVSTGFAILFGLYNMKKSNKAETTHDASNITTVIVKLENIGNDINEIKSNIHAINTDVKENSLKIAKMEQQIKALEKNVFKNANVDGSDYHEN